MPKKSLQQIQAQIAKLQAEAELIKKREAAGVIARIKEAIAHYGLTAEDLGLTTSTRVPAKKASAKAKAAKPAAAAKAAKPKAAKTRKPRPSYSDGTYTWSGMGPKPKWFKEALSQGKTAEDLLVKA